MRPRRLSVAIFGGGFVLFSVLWLASDVVQRAAAPWLAADAIVVTLGVAATVNFWWFSYYEPGAVGLKHVELFGLRRNVVSLNAITVISIERVHDPVWREVSMLRISAPPDRTMALNGITYGEPSLIALAERLDLAGAPDRIPAARVAHGG